MWIPSKKRCTKDTRFICSIVMVLCQYFTYPKSQKCEKLNFCQDKRSRFGEKFLLRSVIYRLNKNKWNCPTHARAQIKYPRVTLVWNRQNSIVFESFSIWTKIHSMTLKFRVLKSIAFYLDDDRMEWRNWNVTWSL